LRGTRKEKHPSAGLRSSPGFLSGRWSRSWQNLELRAE